MSSALKLNTAAIQNLLGGHLPTYANVQRIEEGLRLVPLKVRRSGSVEVVDNLIPIEDTDTKRGLAVRRNDDGSLIIYQTEEKRKSFQPSAKIIPFVRNEGENTDISQDDEEVEETVTSKMPSMIIRRSEIEAPRATPLSEPEPVRSLEDSARDWVASRKPNRPVMKFSAPVVDEPIEQSAKRELSKTIVVPKSFDRRRDAGLRTVDVTVKRRRFHL